MNSCKKTVAVMIFLCGFIIPAACSMGPMKGAWNSDQLSVIESWRNQARAVKNKDLPLWKSITSPVIIFNCRHKEMSEVLYRRLVLEDNSDPKRLNILYNPDKVVAVKINEKQAYLDVVGPKGRKITRHDFHKEKEAWKWAGSKLKDLKCKP